ERLHCEDGPALTYSDGYKVFSWHGTTVPGWIILQPDRILPANIEKESNVEIRRVLLERYGEEKYLCDSGAKILHATERGTLYRKDLPGDEPLVMVRVKNSTAEPDGTFKHYYLRVPPTTQTVDQAIAWTFGLATGTYNPDVET